MRVFRDALCGFAPSTSEFVLQAQGLLPPPRGAALPVTLLGGVGWLWARGAALPHLWYHNAAAEALGRAASSPVLPRHAGHAAESGTDELLFTTRGRYRGSPAEPAGRCYTLDSVPGLKPVQLWAAALFLLMVGGAEASAVVAAAPDPSVTCHLLPQAPCSSGRVPACSRRLLSLLKASVLAGPL